MGFAENLKRIRESKNISQSELARRTDLSRSAICNFEKGRRTKITGPTVRALARALGVPMQDLVGPLSMAGKIEYSTDFKAAMEQEMQILGEQLKSDERKSIIYYLIYDDLFLDIAHAYEELTPAGRIEARKRMKELTEIKAYNKHDNFRIEDFQETF